MKKLFLLLALPLLATTMQAKSEVKNEECKRVRPNYALAERFSPNKIGRMVKSPSITPHWFSDGKRFWYSWTYADGTRYYIVDTKSGKKKEMWDMAKLAAEITEKTETCSCARSVTYAQAYSPNSKFPNSSNVGSATTLPKLRK